MFKSNKKIFSGLLALGFAVMLSSCSITVPVNATSNAVGSKVGTATGTCYLGYLCFGADASIQSAAQNGGISRISTVDMKRTSILGIVVTYQTIVTGE